MIMIDYKDTRPIYEQVVEKIQMLILKGVLESNSKMPSVRTLAMELSINPNTIQKAYAELERRGFIYTVKGRGNFVSYDNNLVEFKKDDLKEKLMLIVNEAKEIGMKEAEIIDYIKQGDKA